MRAVLVAASLAPALAAAAPSLSVRAGGVFAVSPGRAAPSVELGAGVPLSDDGKSRLEASFSGWTLESGLSPGAETELAALVAASWSFPLAGLFSWSFGAGPAIRVADGPLSPPAVRVGAGIAPGLSLRTRRPTLSLDLAARAAIFTDGPRFSVVAGATYLFR